MTTPSVTRGITSNARIGVLALAVAADARSALASLDKVPAEPPERAAGERYSWADKTFYDGSAFVEALRVRRVSPHTFVTLPNRSANSRPRPLGCPYNLNRLGKVHGHLDLKLKLRKNAVDD